MNIRHTLRTIVAPELNLFYTVPPFKHGNTVDCGWFCREHALHVKVVCALLGISADIRLGEFHLTSPDVPLTFSGESGDGHAWCRVKATVPVDLSMTFKLYAAGGAGPQLYAPVFGTGRNGDYVVSYHRFDEATPPSPAHPHHIVFREHELINHSAEALSQNPYLLVHAPDPTNDLNWDALYGPEIYGQISFHCFSVATRRAKSLCGRISAIEAPKWIASQYPAALADILSML